VQAWFALTHEVEAVGMGGAVCRCVRLPGPGSLADQDAWLWEALGIMRDVSTEILAEQMRERAPRG